MSARPIKILALRQCNKTSDNHEQETPGHGPTRPPPHQAVFMMPIRSWISGSSWIAGFVLTLFGLVLITFLIGRVIPIDPVLAVVGDRAPLDVIEQVRREMGLDRPLYEQFWLYLSQLATGDLGRSVLTGNPVWDDIKRTFPATLELATAATLIGVVLGIPLGMMAAKRAGGLIDQGIRVIGLLGYSVPIFWLGLMALLVFYATLDWTAGPGRIDVWHAEIIPPVTGILVIDSLIAQRLDIAHNALSHLILPAGVLGFYALSQISRMTRALMIEQLTQDYILAARAKGVAEWLVLWRHALRNIAAPLLTFIALTYASLLEGSVLTETVFSWPGLGRYITDSLFSADMNAVLGGTLVVGVVFITINRLTDVVSRLIDPRLREKLA